MLATLSPQNSSDLSFSYTELFSECSMGVGSCQRSNFLNIIILQLCIKGRFSECVCAFTRAIFIPLIISMRRNKLLSASFAFLWNLKDKSGVLSPRAVKSCVFRLIGYRQIFRPVIVLNFVFMMNDFACGKSISLCRCSYKSMLKYIARLVRIRMTCRSFYQNIATSCFSPTAFPVRILASNRVMAMYISNIIASFHSVQSCPARRKGPSATASTKYHSVVSIMFQWINYLYSIKGSNVNEIS